MSHHLLSLPVETLDTVISFLVHPIDAYNLSRTCKYLHVHLESQSNSFWYNLLRMHMLRLNYGWPYDPKRDYFFIAKRDYLSFGACHLCFAYNSTQERKWLGKMGVGKETFRALGAKVCASCFVEHTVPASEFSLFGLDIETNPPKSVYCLEPNKRKNGKLFYWRFDIDNLCIAQRGYSLSVLRNIHADEVARIELDEKRGLHWKYQCVITVKAALADRAWEIWSENDKYRYARETFAADMTKKKLQQLLCLTERHRHINQPWFLKRKLAEATSKAAFARMDQLWIGDMAIQLLIHLRNVRSYLQRCTYWHRQRIMVELERTHRLDVAETYGTCHLCRNSLRSRGVNAFLLHMRFVHDEFWEDGSWMMV